MAFNIHNYFSSRGSLHEKRELLENELSQNEDTKDSEWGIDTDRGSIKRQLSDVNEELERRSSRD